MTDLIFQVPGKPPVLIRDRDVNDVGGRNLGHAMGRTDGAQVFAYAMALESQPYSWQWTDLPHNELEKLKSFFFDDCQGTFNLFTVTIPAGDPAIGNGSPITLNNCRMSSSGLNWSDAKDGWFSVSLNFFVQAEGPTGPPT